MEAIVIEKPGAAHHRQVPEPEPGAGECLLQPLAGGICGTDVHIWQGDFLGRYPVIPCHEFSARVIASGPGVTGLEIGDIVAVDPNIRCGRCPACRRGEINLCEAYEAIGVTRPGGFAGRVCAPAANLHRLSGADPGAAAFTEPLACVLYGQSRLDWEPGLRVIIWGAGAIGLLHLQVCQQLRGARVTMVDRDAARVAAAARLGAAQSLLWENGEPPLLRGELWDIAIDATGNAAAAGRMFRYLRRGGQALLFGVYPTAARLDLAPTEIFTHDWKILGSFTYRHEFAQAAQLIGAAAIDTASLIARCIPLAEVPGILARMAAGEALGKVQVFP